jgi:hypothetical protein
MVSIGELLLWKHRAPRQWLMCARKDRFDSAHAAAEHIATVMARGDKPPGLLRKYYCPFCHGHHVTSKPKRVR